MARKRGRPGVGEDSRSHRRTGIAASPGARARAARLRGRSRSRDARHAPKPGPLAPPRLPRRAAHRGVRPRGGVAPKMPVDAEVPPPRRKRDLGGEVAAVGDDGDGRRSTRRVPRARTRRVAKASAGATSPSAVVPPEARSRGLGVRASPVAAGEADPRAARTRSHARRLERRGWATDSTAATTRLDARLREPAGARGRARGASTAAPTPPGGRARRVWRAGAVERATCSDHERRRAMRSTCDAVHARADASARRLSPRAAARGRASRVLDPTAAAREPLARAHESSMRRSACCACRARCGARPRVATDQLLDAQQPAMGTRHGTADASRVPRRRRRDGGGRCSPRGPIRSRLHLRFRTDPVVAAGLTTARHELDVSEVSARGGPSKPLSAAAPRRAAPDSRRVVDRKDEGRPPVGGPLRCECAPEG